MKIIGALLLALLSIGFFPFSMRVLLTAPGLLLAAMSIALMFFAYRLVTHSKKKKLFAADADVFSLPTPTPTPTPTTFESKSLLNSEFMLTPAMPNVTQSTPRSGCMIGSRMVMFFQAPQSIAKSQTGFDSPLRYLFAASVFNSENKKWNVFSR